MTEPVGLVKGGRQGLNLCQTYEPHHFGLLIVWTGRCLSVKALEHSKPAGAKKTSVSHPSFPTLKASEAFQSTFILLLRSAEATAH